ncbi:MAG: hypothetical protein HLUCCA08_06875 [Rhodobacteraceae bacterium HLUCCA08]|nr:MAG: hypothetical protein HLUCCA08_06875 [Rhodobacteraceae bacterium HLUCCA08]
MFEYKVVPAPKKGRKARGVKGSDGRFAHALEHEMNRMGAEGWEFQRADTLPCEEREGLMGRTTLFQTMLVFRRPLAATADAAPAEEAPAALIEDRSADAPAQDSPDGPARVALTLAPETRLDAPPQAPAAPEAAPPKHAAE